MHEIGIVRQIRKTVEDCAQSNNIHKISAVVDCGELSLIVPKYLQEMYAVVVKGSILEGSALIINEIPGMAECDDCDEIFNVVDNKGYCPNCGSFSKTILSGRDFSITEIHTFE